MLNMVVTVRTADGRVVAKLEAPKPTLQ